MNIFNRIAMKFIDNTDFNMKINQVLAMMGESLDVCRMYIFLDNEDGTKTSNTHEWCNGSVEPQIYNLQELSYDDFSSWRKLLKLRGIIIEHDIYNLPDDIVEILKIQDIKSIVIVPIIVQESLVGFIGVDECRRKRFWNKQEVDLLSTLGLMISSTYEKEIEKNSLKVFRNNVESFFNSVDNMIIISDSNSNIIFTNKKFKESSGIDIELRGLSIFDCGFIELYRDDVFSQIENGKPYNSEIVVNFPSKNPIPASLRMWKGEYEGTSCLFLTIKDITYEKKLMTKFEKIFRNNPAPMAIIDMTEYRFMDVNNALLKIFGFSRGDIINKTPREMNFLYNEDEYDSIRNKIEESERVSSIRVSIRSNKENDIEGLLFGEILKEKNTKIFIGVLLDISKQVRLNNDIVGQKIRLENIIESIQAGTWEWDIVTDTLIINSRWAEIIGYSREELEPASINTWKRFVQMDDFVKSQIVLKEHFNRQKPFYESEFRMRHKSGRWIWILSKGKVIDWDEDGKPLKMFGTHTDITELKLMQQQLKEVSIKDSLTGLYNRRYFIEYISKMVDEYTREKNDFSIALLDIDHFKHVNDNYGHLCGDFILKEFSDLLVHSLRSYDIVARYGGEEFIILCKNSNRENSIRILNRILEKIREHVFVYEGQDVKITFSGGVSDADEIIEESPNVEKIIDLADKRMYMAKNAGRDMIM